MSLYRKESSQFPTNSADIGVSDPAVQRARDAGDIPPEPISTLGVELVHATVAVRCARMDFRFVLDVLDARGGSVLRTKLARISEYLDAAADALDRATEHYKRSQ
jgi:hypothetical protein